MYQHCTNVFNIISLKIIQTLSNTFKSYQTFLKQHQNGAGI